jgi:hypothetical protein
MKRIRGLKSLVQSAVEHGSRAVEKVQIEVAKMPFDLLEQVPPLKLPVSGARLVYNTGVSSTHVMIRLVNKVVGDTIDAVMDQVSPDKEAKSDKADPPADAKPTKTEKTAN